MVRTRRSYLAAAGATGATLASAGCLGVAGPGDALDPDVDSVELLLNWKPSGLHLPYYAALERGYYEEQGLEVSGIEAGQGSDFAAQQAGLGNVDFAITSGDQLLNVNAKDLSPRCVGVVMQRSPVVVFTAREEFGEELTDPAQLEGVTVGSGPGMVRTMTETYLEHHGLLESVDYVDSGFDTVQQLLSGEIDAAGGVFGDAISARHRDATVDVLSVHEAIPSYGHVVATPNSFTEDHPDAVRAFLRGTARGAAWAHDDPEAATDILVDRVPELGEARAIQRDKWETLSTEYMLSETVREEGWGWNDGDVWQSTYETLRNGFLEDEVDPDAVWTNDYLDRDYEYVGDYAAQLEE